MFFRVFLALVVGLVMARLRGAVERMNAEELNSLLGKPDVVVIDLRTRGEWQGCRFKVPNAVHEDPTDLASWAAKYSKDDIFVLYCS